jgi:hypothetical protein
MRIEWWCVPLVILAACGPRVAGVPVALKPRVVPPVATSAEPVPAAAPRELGSPTAPKAPGIRYDVVRARGAEPDGESFMIVAERERTTFVVSSPQANHCTSVLLERDLDGDGLTDALIQYGVCGNCCPSIFYFVAGTMGDHFEAQELAAQWNPPELKTWRGRSSIALETDNNGANISRPQKVTRRFVFERGRAVIVEENHAVELKALVDLRSEQFDTTKLDEELTVSFDLDGDRRLDKLVGTLWLRWGSIVWRVQFADGRVADGGSLACKRLGVLPEKTKGYRDLVCDFDTRIRWNGQAYSIPIQ